MVLKLGALKAYSFFKPNNKLLINYFLRNTAPQAAISSHLSELDRCPMEEMLELLRETD